MGIKFGAGLFNRNIENKLKKYNFVDIFLDSMIIKGTTDQEHIERVMCILKYFYEHGIGLNEQKFKFTVPEVSLSAYKISEGSVKPIPEKVAPVVYALPTANVSQLCSYCVDYYCCAENSKHF